MTVSADTTFSRYHTMTVSHHIEEHAVFWMADLFNRMRRTYGDSPNFLIHNMYLSFQI